MIDEKRVDPEHTEGEIPIEKGNKSSENKKQDKSVGDSENAEKHTLKKGAKAVKKYEDKIQELEEKLKEINGKYLRLFSDFDNFRKRTAKERLDLLNIASEEVILSLLPVIDDFERALAVVEKNNNNTDYEGIKLIYNKLTNILGKKGLSPINSKGEIFDTDFHETFTIIPAPSEDMKNKVIDEIQKGYILNGKVIRFARVVVGQ